MDPTREQWGAIADAVEARGHLPFFDVAYQGFASGSLDDDAWAPRFFAERGIEMMVAQSYSKNLGPRPIPTYPKPTPGSLLSCPTAALLLLAGRHPFAWVHPHDPNPVMPSSLRPARIRLLRSPAERARASAVPARSLVAPARECNLSG